VKPEYKLGNITNTKLKDLANSSAQYQFGENKRINLPEKCKSCDWLTLCNGGCPKDRALNESGRGLNHLCSGLARFFAHATPVLRRVIQLTRRGESPATIMDSLRTQAKLAWINIGRNDLCLCGSGRKAKYCCWSKRPDS
jgi:uncharacterized protein